MNLSFCVGCGVKKQSENCEMLGFTNQMNMLYCKRCHDINNFNELPKLNHTSEYYHAKLFEIAEKYKEIYWVIDVFDFSEQTNELLIKLIDRKCDVSILVNKIDLLPKSIKKEKIINWCYENFKNVKFKQLMLISSAKKTNIDELFELISSQKKAVLFAGNTNSGKSSIINALMKSVDLNHMSLTTSNYVGTTLDQIEIDFERYGFSIIDSPGLVAEKSIYKFLGRESIKLISPNKELKPYTYQISKDCSILIESLVAFDLFCDKPFSVTFYIPQSLKLFRTKHGNAINILTKHFKTDFFQIPNSLDSFSLDDYDLIQHRIVNGEELSISSIGFFKVSCDVEVRVEVFKNKNISIFKRNALFVKGD